MNDDKILGEKVADMVHELRSLRMVNESQANTIGLLRGQYDELAKDYEEREARHDAELRRLRTERDVAKRGADAVNAILQITAKHVMEGLRAIKGDEEPALQSENILPGPVPQWQRELRATMDH